MRLPRLLLLTDRSQLSLGRGLVRTVEECVLAGLEAVVVREHDLDPTPRRALVERLAGIDGLTVISSRIADPAADAINLAAHQERSLAGGFFGRSCHHRDDVGRAAGEGASWALLSPYAESESKPGRDPLPADSWAGHPIPVFALAGVEVSNARAALRRGAHGVAAMGAVMRAPDPASVVADLVEALR